MMNRKLGQMKKQIDTFQAILWAAEDEINDRILWKFTSVYSKMDDLYDFFDIIQDEITDGTSDWIKQNVTRRRK